MNEASMGMIDVGVSLRVQMNSVPMSFERMDIWGREGTCATWTALPIA